MGSMSEYPDPAQVLTHSALLVDSVKRKRSRTTARELQALVTDNNQRTSLRLPKCPFCLQRIEPQHWELHYDYELGRLNQLESELYTDPSNKAKGKRGAAVLARQHLETKQRKRPTSVYEDALEKVKRNGTRRKEALRQVDMPMDVDAPVNAPPTARQGGGEQQTCFICNETLFGDSEAVNLHIDRCLMNMNNASPTAAAPSQSPRRSPSSSSTLTSTAVNSTLGISDPAINSNTDGQWDEYEWAGQIRVRASAMMEGGYGGAGFTTAKKEEDEDEDEDLDIEDDDVEYGTSQYNELDIMVNSDEDNEDTNALREMISGGSSKQEEGEDDDDDDDDDSDSQLELDFEETVSDEGWNRYLATTASSSSDAPVSTSGNLVVESLKSRIHQLELASRSVPRCLICLDPYNKPLTSIVCWHVHCEKCWLQTLGSKKLCPQCQKITTPADLRRIYL
ncbi:hypothetical protein [Absidia glauca]|uniref:RING-type domain-containing protein n=1 Tax=Absidia glauca TaxID=4829 RepID=A0A163K0C1_ABSGL|nr:hypothetical protein [Absidia glauca]